MISAMKAGLEAGQNCSKNTRVAYVKILRSCLDLAGQFNKMNHSGPLESNLQRIQLVNVMELHILVNIYALFLLCF